MAALVQVTSIKQAEPIASPASVQIDFNVLGILPDLVQVFASGLSGDIGILKDEVEMSPPEISYTSTIQLAGGSFFSISLCPRTVTNGVLDDKIDDQPWETFCTFTTITTQAPGTGGDKPAPVITTAEPHPATIKQQNGIKISWRSVHYELFNVRFAEQGNPENQVEIDSPGTDVKAQYEHSRADRVRFCERIRRDIERIFTPTYKVFWRILPPGEWTVDSVVSHYAELQRANPHVRFDLDRLRRVFSLSPLSLYVGIDEFEGYIVFVFSQTKNVLLECPVYGNAIYLIREDWESLSRLSKGELLARFPGQALRIVHTGDWYPRVQAELFSRVR
jgi:hypothetical protein